jgi:pimeloyl-ACP methyl ester carboxylesterase
MRWSATAAETCLSLNGRQRRSIVSAQAKPSIVFCHGLWADGSCFSKLITPLQAEGYEVIAAQYGLDSPDADVETVIHTLGRVSSPAILVGHSYGGSVITAAGTDDRVAGLVYIAALAPDEDETSQSQQEKFPVTDVFQYVEVTDGRLWLKPDGIDCFAGDLPAAEKGLVWATHYAPDANLFSHNAPGVAWKTKPSWYIVATQDRTVHPDLERFVADRMNATTYEVESSHVPMLSHPEVVLDVIRDAAKAIREQTVASGVA